MELWAEERAKLDGVFNSVRPTPADVTRVVETFTFGPKHDPGRRCRWELVAAIVYGDARRPFIEKAIMQWRLERGRDAKR